jgi:hypothetical protein
MKMSTSNFAIVRMRADYDLERAQKKIPLAMNANGIFGFRLEID